MRNGWPLSFQWISDAEEGLHFLRHETLAPADMIFLDIKMPKITGLEILERLKKEGRFTHLPPITVLSSSQLSKDINHAKSFPGVTYETKPEGYLAMKDLANRLIPPNIIH